MAIEQQASLAPLDADVDADLQRLKELLESNDVEGARTLVKELAARWPESKVVAHFARVLQKPVARVVHGERSRSTVREQEWLKSHAREYPGCWLAVSTDGLVAADPDGRKVFEVARETVGLDKVVLFYQP